MSYANLFWFNKFAADTTVSVTNRKVELYIKKLILDSAAEKNGVYFDPRITTILNADVYYLNLKTKKSLINCINKNCNLDISPYVLNLKVTLSDGTNYIFVESKTTHKYDLIEHRLQVQFYYDFKNHFLRNNISRSAAEFKRRFHEPIAKELKDFLSKTK